MRVKLWGAFFVGCVLSAGCNSEPPVSATASTTVAVPAPKFAPPITAPAVKSSPQKRQPKAAPPTAATLPASEPVSVAAAPYAPPFPDRVDLFVPPKRQGGAPAQAGGGERQVELVGFIRVDEPKAVLSIDGQPVSLAAGMSVQGIEVISIQPPNAVLQRGRQRWQASLEN